MNKENLIPLGHLDIIKEGDYVFDDFDTPSFRVGINHPRVGTEYDSSTDMPIYRLKEKTMMKDIS